MTGGANLDGAVIETLDEIGLKLIQNFPENEIKLRTSDDSKYKFKMAGYDIAREEFHRIVLFDTQTGIITIKSKHPFELTNNCEDKVFHL